MRFVKVDVQRPFKIAFADVEGSAHEMSSWGVDVELSGWLGKLPL